MYLALDEPEITHLFVNMLVILILSTYGFFTTSKFHSYRVKKG